MVERAKGPVVIALRLVVIGFAFPSKASTYKVSVQCPFANCSVLLRSIETEAAAAEAANERSLAKEEEEEKK